MRNTGQPSWQSFFLLAFGLGVLAFLVAIDKVEWFHLRPASGTAMALAAAATAG